MRWKRMFVLVLLLLAGVFYSGYSVTHGFLRFYRAEGTYFKFFNCKYPNPVLTPCFWGSVAFLAAYVWSVKILLMRDLLRSKWHITSLFWFLSACVVFGWVNVGIEFTQLYILPTQKAVGCTVDRMTSIFQSSCLYGSCIYLTAWLYSGWLRRM